jgi:hypothetical protein
MKKGSIDAKRIGEGSWGEGWCERRCDVKKSRKVENETTISSRRTLRESIGIMRNSRQECRIKMEII